MKWSATILCAIAWFTATPLIAQIRTVYIVPSSHWDRGFVTNPKSLDDLVSRHLDQVIAAAESDPSFRWTIESEWQLDAWLERNHDPQRRMVLRKLIESGQIELSAAYGSMHTSFMDAEELNQLTRDSRVVARTLGVSAPKLAMMDDVPGFEWNTVQSLSGAGIHYLLNGANTPFGGGTTLAPGHVPFYWEGQDGGRVLTWVSEGKNGGYPEGFADYYLAPRARDWYYHQSFLPHELQGQPDLKVVAAGIAKLVKTYTDAGYKYDAVLVILSHDFISPEEELRGVLPIVRAWNAAGRQPQLRVATPSEFFSHIVGRYGADLPTYRGSWSGLWARVKTNSPGISSVARRDQTGVRTAGLLWAGMQLRWGVSYPAGNIDLDLHRLWNYDEHSGSGQVGWPGVMSHLQLQRQNQDYVDYVCGADQDLRMLMRAGLRRAAQLAAIDTPGIPHHGAELATFQPASWQSNTVIELGPEEQGVSALEEPRTHQQFPVQWEAGNGTAVIPAAPLSVELWTLQHGRSAVNPVPLHTQPVLANRFYRLSLRTADGSIEHLVDLETGEDIVDASGHSSFNQLVVTQANRRLPPIQGPIRFLRLQGPVYDALQVLRPESVAPLTEYRLYHHVKRLEIRDVLDGAHMPPVTLAEQPQLYSFAFPFFPAGAIHSVQYEDGVGLVDFPAGHLPGGRQDAVVSHGLVLDHGQFHVAFGSPEAFYWDLPGLAGPARSLTDRTVLSEAWSHANESMTNDVGPFLLDTVEPGLPARQQFTYVLSSWQGPDQAGVKYRRLWSAILHPAVQRVGAGDLASASGPLFTVNTPDAVLIGAIPLAGDDNAILLRVQEVAGEAQHLQIGLPSPDVRAVQTDLTGAPLQPSSLRQQGAVVSLDLAAHATVTLRLTNPKKAQPARPGPLAAPMPDPLPQEPEHWASCP